MSYYRKCPSCDELNSEFSGHCTECGELINQIEPLHIEQLTHKSNLEQNRCEILGEQEQEQVHEQESTLDCITLVPNSSADDWIIIEDGQIFGAKRSNALSEGIVQYHDNEKELIHHRHCRFNLVAGQWQVTALDQHDYGKPFTNPTFINSQEITPGEHICLNHNDSVILSDTHFKVIIP